MSTAIESYKNLGAVAFGIFWFMTAVMLWKLGGDRSKSISEHATTTKKINVLFGVVAAISVTLLGLFFVGWFSPTFMFGSTFNIPSITIIFLYGVAGVVPDTSGLSHWIHNSAAVVGSVLLIPVMLLMAMNQTVGSFARLFTLASLVIMLYLGYMIMKNKNGRSKFLAYEAVYFLCFDVSILVVTYVR